MILKGIDNQKVELKIMGYQFPEINTPGDWDSNWLSVYIDVHSKIDNWQTVDPSLTTSEVREIIKWFRDLSLNKEVEYAQLGFIEPNLEFNLIDKDSNLKHIKMIFNAESKPKSAREDEEYCVDFRLSNNDLAKAADELENGLEKYPER